MDFSAVKTKAHELFNEASFIARITNDTAYRNALALMDELVEYYEKYLPLIELLSISINNWEDQADEFAQFNRDIAKLSTGVALLKVLMQQHHLTAGDLREEIGARSTVSMVLNGTRNLTLDHIKALALRFHLAPAAFL